MTLDPDVQKWLQQVEASGETALDAMSVEDAREYMRTSSAQLGRLESVPRVEDLVATGPAGDIPLRLYDPIGTGPLPIVVYFHGGGWVLGGIDTHDGYCRALANASGMMVVSVDYRLAPEHPYPAAAEDAYAATAWLAEHAASLGGDSERIAVAGDSAGGNLAAVTCLMARDREGPALRMQVLIYPIVDHDFDTDSYLRNMIGFHLTRDAMIWFWDLYSPEISQRDQPYASPLRAVDLTGLPPAMVMTAEYDPLVDEGEAYAQRLEAAGVKVQLKRYPGTIHGFARRINGWAHAREALEDVAKALQTAMQ
jgi:acetyl esterase